MNIKEAEKLSGVSSRNIRFYEQKGLVNPARNTENDYREYSEKDIHRLKLIRALRMVDMPLEQIKCIVDGEVPMQKAVAQQKRELKQKIKKIETAVRFCDELERADKEDIGEVLMRMDEPENREFLSKQWRTDHAEKAKQVCGPLFAGLLPMLISLLLYIPMVLAGAFAHGYLFVGSLLILLGWFWLGKRLYHEKRWLVNAVLFAVFPLTALVLLLLDGPTEWIGSVYLSGEEMLQLYYLQYRVPLEVVTHQLKLQTWHYLIFFAINIGIFGLGVLRRKATQKKTPFFSRLFDAHPILCVLIGSLLVAFVLIAPAFVMDISPHYYDPAQLQKDYPNNKECLAQTENGTVWFEVTEEFAQIARFNQWERKYLRFFGEKSLRIDEDSIDAGADLTFYDNDCVVIHLDGWKSGGISYSFRVPEGVVEALMAYVREHTIREAEE